ncbi:MAG: D-alanyl-D-alanine carboxypeptidase [Syntrophomonadaceae bacterium]|nr:D-alanyl-D-alanine carboxypeptidase [Syntrophomonadaceae bacterium]
MSRTAKFLLLVIFLILVPVQSISAVPYISSKYYCLVDAQSGQIILSHQPHEQRPVASTTKMLTAILATEYCDLQETATVSPHADRTPEYTIGLRTGQQVTVGELLKATLVRSSNDAAVVLAEHVAGDELFFSYLMSKKACLIASGNTYFENASGLPSKNHYSTAFDLAQIGRYCLQYDYLRELVASKSVEFKHPGYRKPITLTNTNGLLVSFPGADGIKTGTTNAAGKCLVASATRQGRQLIAVSLKSGDRQGDCRRLLEHGFNKTRLIKIVDSTQVIKEISLGEIPGYKLQLYAGKDVHIWQGEGKLNIEKQVIVDYNPSLPVKAGQKLGSLTVWSDGQIIDTVALISDKTVYSHYGWLERWGAVIRNWLLNTV